MKSMGEQTKRDGDEQRQNEKALKIK